MFQDLQSDQMQAALEALLFVSDEPVGVITLAEMLECDEASVEAALIDLRDSYDRDKRGIQLREVAGGWQLFTSSDYHELLEKYIVSLDTRKLTGAAMEALAIIAYTQPTTRSSVAYTRGVNSDSPINSLIEKGFVREVGIADTPGNPVLYGTTRTFLEKFGLKSINDLPDLADFAPDEETRRLITERLGGSQSDGLLTDEQAHAVIKEMSFSQVTGEPQRSSESSDSRESRSTADIFSGALASTLGVVDKIDFDSLTFDTDDE